MDCAAADICTWTFFSVGKSEKSYWLAANQVWKIQTQRKKMKAQSGFINSQLRFQFLRAGGSAAQVACLWCMSSVWKKKELKNVKNIDASPKTLRISRVLCAPAWFWEPNSRQEGQKDEMSSDIGLCGCGWLPLSCHCTTAFPLFHFFIPSQAEAQSPREISHPAQCDEGNVCACVCAWKQDKSQRQGKRAKLFFIFKLQKKPVKLKKVFFFKSTFEFYWKWGIVFMSVRGKLEICVIP